MPFRLDEVGGQSRLILPGFEKEIKQGVRCYKSPIAVFFLWLCGQIRDDTSKTIHVSKSSLKKWLESHQEISQSLCNNDVEAFLNDPECVDKLVNKCEEEVQKRQFESKLQNRPNETIDQEKNEILTTINDIDIKLDDKSIESHLFPQEVADLSNKNFSTQEGLLRKEVEDIKQPEKTLKELNKEILDETPKKGDFPNPLPPPQNENKELKIDPNNQPPQKTDQRKEGSPKELNQTITKDSASIIDKEKIKNGFAEFRNQIELYFKPNKKLNKNAELSKAFLSLFDLFCKDNLAEDPGPTLNLQTGEFSFRLKETGKYWVPPQIKFMKEWTPKGLIFLFGYNQTKEIKGRFDKENGKILFENGFGGYAQRGTWTYSEVNSTVEELVYDQNLLKIKLTNLPLIGSYLVPLTTEEFESTFEEGNRVDLKKGLKEYFKELK